MISNNQKQELRCYYNAALRSPHVLTICVWYDQIKFGGFTVVVDLLYLPPYTWKNPKLITGSKEPFFLFTIGWWNNHFHVHIFIPRCLRLLSILVFLSRFDLSHKIFHVRTMLYTERNVQQFSLKPRGEIYVILLTYSKFKMQHILCMCHSNVHTNIKRIWVLSTRWKWNVHDSLIVSPFNKKHSWILSKVLKYHNKTIWESYIFDLPSHQTRNTWRYSMMKKIENILPNMNKTTMNFL